MLVAQSCLTLLWPHGLSLGRRQWHPTPVLLPGKSHGRRSLVGCSPWGWEESDSTKQLHFHFSLSCIGEGNVNPLQCSCLENPGEGGAWGAAVCGVAQSQTQLKWLSSSSSRAVAHQVPPIHGILQARLLEWVAISSSRGSSWPRDQTWVSCITGRFFAIWATWGLTVDWRPCSSSRGCSQFLAMWASPQGLLEHRSSLLQRQQGRQKAIENGILHNRTWSQTNTPSPSYSSG